MTDASAQPGVGRQAGRPAARRRLVLSDRDRALLHAVWSLGAADSGVLQSLVVPDTQRSLVAVRLTRLAAEGWLARQRVSGGPWGHPWLYRTGPTAHRAHPGWAHAWRPPLAQLEHTLLTGHLLAELAHPMFRWPDGRVVAPAGWTGESELRGWAPPGAPYPDGLLHYRLPTDLPPEPWRPQAAAVAGTQPVGGPSGTAEVAVVCLETDRGTEPLRIWRAKLARYRDYPPGGLVVAVTPGPARAQRLSQQARETGVAFLAGTREALTGPDSPLPQALLGGGGR